VKISADDNANMSLSTSPDVLAAHLSGEAVLLNLADKSYYRLNETAALVWAGFERGESTEEILAALLSTYAVSEEDARKEVDAVITDMRTKKLLVEKS
jgi:hypothetical protein